MVENKPTKWLNKSKIIEIEKLSDRMHNVETANKVLSQRFTDLKNRMDKIQETFDERNETFGTDISAIYKRLERIEPIVNELNMVREE